MSAAIRSRWSGCVRPAEALGLRDVQTYVQSGNIVFETSLGVSRLAQTLKTTIDAQTRQPVTVVVRTAAELAKVIAANPFLKQKGVDPRSCMSAFLDKASAKPPLERLDALARQT